MKKFEAAGSRGLTLVELTLAVALSGMILTALYSMLHASAKNWQTIRKRGDLYQTGRAVLNRLELDLSRALPMKTMPFQGNENALSFLIADRLSPVTTRVDYRMSAQNALSPDDQTIARITQDLSADNTSSPLKKETTWNRIKEARFSFAYRNPGGTIWLGEWKGGKIPRGVKARLVLESSDGTESVTLEKIFTLLNGEWGVQG